MNASDPPADEPKETPSESVSVSNSSSAAASPDRPKWTLPLVLLATLMLVFSGVGLWFLRSDLPPVTAEMLSTAKALWEKKGPANYDLTVQLGGDSPGIFQVEVRDGKVQSPPTRNGIAVAAQQAWETWSIQGQFETIERELELAADPEHEMKSKVVNRLVLRGEFDPLYGYPRKFHRFAVGHGPEVYWEVTKFAPIQ